MTRPGPPPKPVELKILEGNPGKRKLPKVPKFAPLSEQPPEELNEIGQDLWRRLMQEFGRTNIVQRTDREALIMLCDMWAVYQVHMAIVREHGALVKSGHHNRDRSSIVVNPAWRVARDAQREFSQIAARFGLTPADRARLGVFAPTLEEDPRVRLLD